jgi:amidase
MATYITRAAGVAPPASVSVAVKDLIDVAGFPTTAGCLAVAERAEPAATDADCLAGVRRAGCFIAAKANLHELAHGATGENPHFGTPKNPIDPTKIPGGSSSGSAVAVALGEVAIGVGSDTGGSIRVPAACCGIVGLKTSYGRIPLGGVWPLAPSLDTVGPMGIDVAATALGLRLLDPNGGYDEDWPGGDEPMAAGWSAGADPAGADPAGARLAVGGAGERHGGGISGLGPLGRVRGLPGVDPEIEHALDVALAEAELVVVDVHLEGIELANLARRTILLAEAWQVDGYLTELPDAERGLSQESLRKLRHGAEVTNRALTRAHATALQWRARLDQLFGQVVALALPTLPCAAPELGRADGMQLVELTALANLTGHPALSLPVPRADGSASLGRTAVPPSLQLVGPSFAEELLLGIGRRIEAAVGVRIAQR